MPEAPEPTNPSAAADRAQCEAVGGYLEAMDLRPQPSEFEPAFIEHAAAYSERKGMTYAAWRRLGVPAGVLNAAGVRPEAPSLP